MVEFNSLGVGADSRVAVELELMFFPKGGTSKEGDTASPIPAELTRELIQELKNFRGVITRLPPEDSIDKQKREGGPSPKAEELYKALLNYVDGISIGLIEKISLRKMVKTLFFCRSFELPPQIRKQIDGMRQSLRMKNAKIEELHKVIKDMRREDDDFLG